MRFSIRARGLVIAVAAGSLLAVVPFATAASAAQSAACAQVTTPPLSSGKNAKATFAKCTPTSLSAGAVVSFIAAPKGTKGGTTKVNLVWNKKQGTTQGLVSYKQNKTNGKCKTGTLRVIVSGSVTGGTGAAAKIIKKKEPIAASFCAVLTGAKTGQSTLEPGTKFKL